MSTVHTDWSDAEYFAHPALSHSDTKLLDPPAKYRHVKDNPKDASKPTSDMQFGTAVHSWVLGGPDVWRIDATDWRSRDAKEGREDAEQVGAIALLRADYDRSKACADAVKAHPLAAKLIKAADHLEVAAVWDDDGVERKAKLDIVAGRHGVDLKTTYNADSDSFGRSAAKYGYATQAAWYSDALRACFGIDDPKFLFIVVEKEPPFLVNVIELDPYDVELGGKRNRQMIDLYRQCVESGEWPGYGDGINAAQLPRWAEMEMEMA